jgi:ABC-2 type transport system permease protein
MTTPTTTLASPVQRVPWARATWSQVLLSQRVFWQDIAFAVIGAAMPVAMGLAPVLSFRDEPTTAGELTPAAVLLPGGMAATLLWIFYTTINSAARRREMRIYKRLRATPLSDSSILFGEAISACLPAIAQSLIVFTAGTTLAHLPLPRHPLVLVLALLLAAATYGLLSMGLSGLLPSGEIATWIVTPFLFGFWYLSGAIAPLSAFPHWLADLSHYLPATATADIFRIAALGIEHHEGAAIDPVSGAAALWIETRPVVVLLIWALIGAVLWKRFFRWDPRRSH